MPNENGPKSPSPEELEAAVSEGRKLAYFTDSRFTDGAAILDDLVLEALSKRVCTFSSLKTFPTPVTECDSKMLSADGQDLARHLLHQVFAIALSGHLRL